jgi:hypothetical protein
MLYCHDAKILSRVGVTIDVVWICEWMYWPLIHTTRKYNYSATANLHNSQMIRAHAKRFPACCVFTSRSLATASNSGHSFTRSGSIFTDSHAELNWTEFQSHSQSYVTTDGQPSSLSWCQAPIWGLRPDLVYCLTVAGFLIWGALSDERTGLPFAIATGPRQRSHFRVRVS